MVRIRVLGQLTAEVAGQPVDLGTSLQRAVVARLVSAAGHIVSTDRFIDDLWQGQAPPKALGALQVYVSNLRRVLEPGRLPRTPATVLVSAPPGYRLQLDPDAVDAWRFPRLIDEAVRVLNAGEPATAIKRIDEALNLWTGSPYAEFADEEWAVAEAAQLEELKLVAVEYRAEAGLALGGHAAAVPDLERHVAAHPLRENAVRLLALSYYRAGRQGEALAVIRRTRETLADELGVDPGPALRTLEGDILAQTETLQLTPPPVRPKRAAAPAAPGIVGRTAELARLTTAANLARGGFRVAWLGGDAGAGKSTLAEALARQLAAAGWATAVGRCPETLGGVPPAWAWSEVLRQLSGVRPLTPELASRLAPLLTDDAPPVGQFWLARAVGEFLDEVPGPLLIVLEDVHRADDETLHLLRHLAVRLAETPVLVLLTHRPTETNDDLMATRAALAVQAAENLTLDGLGVADVATLVRERSGVEVGAATIVTIAERTGGNPLFVSEMARLLGAEGVSAAYRLPPGVRDVIRRRLARLPATAQTTLRNAAVLGRDADADVLIALPEADEETVLDGLEAGVLSGLLTEPAPGKVRFAHVLVRETLYEDIPRLRRTRLHAKVLTTLESVRPGDVGALGHHALAAATPATAIRAAGYGLRAAAKASGLYAHREAVTLLRGALEALGQAAEPDDALTLDVMCRLVSAQALSGDISAAVRVRAEAVALARRMGDPQGLARAACLDAPLIWTIRASRTMETDMVAAIRESIPSADPPLRARLLVALCHQLEGHDHTAIEAASAEAMRIARDLDDPVLLCMALNGLYWVLVYPLRRTELASAGRQMLEMSETHGLPAYQALGHYHMVMVSLGNCDRAQARWHAEQAAKYSTSGQLGHMLAIVAILDALDLVIAGEFDAAEAAYGTLTDRIAETGGINAAVFGAVARFAVRHLAGRGGESLQEITDILHIYGDELHELYIRALIAAGHVDEARAAWRPDIPAKPEVYWACFTVLRAETAMILGNREVAAWCYRELGQLSGEIAGLHSGSVTLGPIDQTLGELAEYLNDPAAARTHYTSAVETADRVGSTHFAQQAREALHRL
ncbi:BTAD domain-containing putative transcriptional regulator [Acrocarpospora pleiomorpha]|uniref:BTAD domain-containing putative transcriptional regulator n=1 Tax=Acrocarpospora pleiomorpha TaxID=90975 RepID=UPI0012D314D6|nr:BTAD domain-containing putative transcriptional regulator [Acrocarpospora pleiomorpha]